MSGLLRALAGCGHDGLALQLAGPVAQARPHGHHQQIIDRLTPVTEPDQDSGSGSEDTRLS